jgi:hypothetical protein
MRKPRSAVLLPRFVCPGWSLQAEHDRSDGLPVASQGMHIACETRRLNSAGELGLMRRGKRAKEPFETDDTRNQRVTRSRGC